MWIHSIQQQHSCIGNAPGDLVHLETKVEAAISAKNCSPRGDDPKGGAHENPMPAFVSCQRSNVGIPAYCPPPCRRAPEPAQPAAGALDRQILSQWRAAAVFSGTVREVWDSSVSELLSSRSPLASMRRPARSAGSPSGSCPAAAGPPAGALERRCRHADGADHCIFFLYHFHTFLYTP